MKINYFYMERGGEDSNLPRSSGEFLIVNPLLCAGVHNLCIPPPKDPPMLKQ